MLKHLLFIHGYSVRDFKSYGNFPKLLAEQLKIAESEVYISAFDSLNNQIDCDDLARSLEGRVSRLIAAGLDISKTAVLCHSTGSIIARRWMLNRVIAQKPCPSHYVSLAGANHGSTLAKLGQTQLIQLRKEVLEGSTIGLGVLSDLDYGSDFLLNLNLEWLTNFAKLKVFCFSVIGDVYDANAPLLPDHTPVFWQIKEKGSDSTVRISGSNLNFKFVRSDQNDLAPRFQIDEQQNTAHLILHGYSHTGQTGILERAEDAGDEALKQVIAALSVTTQTEYDQLRTSWKGINDQWCANAANQALLSSTVIFNIKSPGRFPIDDYVVAILDSAGSARTVSKSMRDHQPMQNSTQRGSISFFVDYGEFLKGSPHSLNITVQSSFGEMQYQSIDFDIPPDLAQLVQPNQTTYIQLILEELNFHILKSNSQHYPAYAKWPPLPPEN